MSCKFISPHTKNELGFSQRLLEYYNLDLFDELDETKQSFFDEKVSYFFSDVFRENFGDWVSEKLSNDRVDVDGAPLLNEVNGNLYVIDKNNEKYFINNRRFEGLEAYPAFRGNVAKLTSDAASMITKFIFDKYKNDTDDITDFSDLSFNLADEVDAFFDNQIELIPENEPVYDTFKDFNADFVEEVKDFLRSINLKYNELDDSDIDYQDGLEDNGTLIGKSSVERDSKDNASGNIRLMLSLLSNPESSSDYFYGKRMLPFGDVWNDVQNVLSNLPKLTSDDGNVINYLDVMKDRLNKMAYNKPYIKELLDVLESSNFNLQAQFFQTFGNLGKTIQDTLEVDTNNYAYRLINASQSDSKKANILTEAGIAFRDKFTTFNTETGEYAFDLVTYGKFRSDYFGLTRGVDGGLSLIQELKKAFKDVRNSENPSQESIDKLQDKSLESSRLLYDLISSLGFNITPLSFEYLIRNNGEVPQITERSLIDTLDRFMIGFNNIDSFLVSNKFKDEASQIDDATKKLFKNKTEYLNLFKGEKNSITGQKVIGDIAEAIGQFQTDNSDNMIMSGNKKICAYSNTSHLFDVTSMLNKSPEEVKFRMSQPNNRHSVYLREISNGNLITIHRTNSMMEVDNTEAAVNNSNTSKNDAIVRDVVESLQGKKATSNSVYATPVPADKGSALKLGIKYFLDTAVRTVEDKVIVNGDTLDVFKGYMNDELSSGIAAKKFIDSNTNNKGEVDTSNLTQYYHVDGKGNTFDILNSSGVSIFQKGAFSDINRNNSNDINRFIEENESESYTMVYAGNAFRNFMIPSLSPEKLLSKPAEFGLFYNSDFTPIDIDINYSENNTETLTTKQITYLNEVLTDKISNLINSTKAALIEKLLFNEDGSRNKFDTALYDVYKTELEGQSEIAILNQIASDYIVNNVIAQIEYSKIYNGSINMHKNGADYVKRVPKTYIDGKGLLLGITPKDHEAHIIVLQDVETSSPYIDQMGEVGKKFYGGNRINQADAQAYITPKRWKFLLERLGQFGKVEKAIYSKIEQMEAGKDVEFTKDELKHLSTKPLKGVYFDNENNSPIYLKYSQVVLLKSLVKGTPLEDLLNKMNDPSAPIDEAIMASGVKVGAQFSKDDISQNLLSRTDFNPKRIKIDNRFWKLQQDLPNKGFKETLLGSQIQKNIFDNFNFDGDYEFNGKTMKGTEVYDNIHSAIGEISNRGLEKIKSRFGVSDDYTITNWGDFSKDIAQQLRDEKIDENIVKAVEKELTPYVVPQSRDKVMSTIMSILNKSTVKLKTNGGSLIQMSNFGLDQNLSEETGIRWIKDKKQLAEPRKFITPEGTTKVLPGQVFISGNLLSNYIPNWKSYTNEQLFGADGQGGMFPKEILQLITYRIPNQAMSSNDAMEIVGILPDTYIDTIVPYTGITTKTGSDFDIDKMFIMLPSLRGLHTYNTTVRNYVNDYLKGDNIPQTIENVQNFMYELQDNGLLFDINSLKEQLLKVDDPKTVVLTLLKEKTNEIIDIIKNIDNKNNPRVKAFKKNIGTTVYKVEYEKFKTAEKNTVDTGIKDGVSEIFKNNTALASIGSEQEYSNYLDSIFPESRVKDIVYHSSPSKFDKFKKQSVQDLAKGADEGIYFSKDPNYYTSDLNKYSVILNLKNEASIKHSDFLTAVDASGLKQEDFNNNDGFITTSSKDKSFEENFSNFYIDDIHYKELFDESGESEDVLYFKNDKIISEKEYNNAYNEYENNNKPSIVFAAVFEPEQIHMLGSNEDISKFKEFVKNNSQELPLSEQSIGALQNRVFEAYHSILTHDGNYDNLITPIDHEHVKNFITKDLGLADTANLDFEAFSPLKQIDVKYKFIAGGFGIGQVANQLVDSISNQVSQEYIEENLGWGNKKAINGVLSTVFDMKSDNGYYSETITYKGKKSSYKISDTLTALLNGFVDIAKDSYITNGNWNTQTTNTGTFLIRAGVHPYKAMSFLAQPALVELIENIAEKEGITSKDKLSGNVLPELKAKYLDLLKGSLNLDEDQFQNLINDINSTKYFTLPLGLESNKITSRSVDRLMDNIKGEKNTPQYYLDQYLSLVEYDTLKPKVKEFTKSVGASKYGENGVGKSIIGHLIQYNKTKDVIDKGYVKNFSQKFYNPEYIKDGYTSLGSYHKNTETFFRNLVQANPRMFITANNFFLNIMNDMVNETHNSKLYLDDENVGRTLETSLYTMIMSESKILKTQNSEFGYFFTKGSDTVPTLSNTVQKVKAQYLEAHKSNFFLENLSVKEEGDLSFVGISNTISKSSDFSRKITEGWKELSVDNPQLADDLVRYAYQQSGFRANNSQIYQYIPHEVFVRNNVNQYVTKTASQILEGNVNAETIKDNIYRHNWDNTKIVPKISYMLDQNNKLLDNDTVSKVYPSSAGFRLSYDSNRHSQLVKDATIDKRFPRFMSANEKLYKLEGYVEVSEGIHEPMYLATHKLGYKSKAGQFHEYSMFREKANSNMITNNVNEQQQHVVDTLRELLKDAKFVPLNEVNDTVEPNVEVVEQEVDTVVIEEEVVDEESSETIQPSDITRKSELKQLFDADTSSPIVKGSVVNYKDKPWIVWNISDANRAQLIDTEGNKFSGTPDINKLQKVGDYRTTVYNGNDYIVSANENIYSLTTGKLVFTNKDKSTLSTKEKIISQIMNENDLEDPFNCKL